MSSRVAAAAAPAPASRDESASADERYERENERMREEEGERESARRGRKGSAVVLEPAESPRSLRVSEAAGPISETKGLS